jgi:hypothetical protein
MQVGSLLMTSLASLAVGVEARCATVWCFLASATSDGRRVDGCRGDGPDGVFVVQDCLGFFRSPRSSIAGPLDGYRCLLA